MDKRILLILSVLTISPSVFATSNAWYFTPSDVNALHYKAADAQLAYGQEQKQIGELRLPTSKGLHPVVMLIHGGCWMERFADQRNIAALADALRDAGFATWNIDYRGIENKNGGWPGTFEDVANAADFLRTISSKYSLDLNKVVVMGHSAGGHLALWLAGRSSISSNSVLYKANPLKVRGVISLGGVPDLQEFRKQSSAICGQDVIASLLKGNESEISARYKDASPMELLPLKTEQVLIYGVDDPVAPANLKKYTENARKAGDRIKVLRIPFAAHHEYNVPNSVTWPVILERVHSMLNDPPMAFG